MHYEVTTSIPESHPSLPGHFPGKPIVPGVVILDFVYSALKEWRGTIQIQSMPSVKFLAPIYPEMPFIISIDALENNQYKFVCSNGKTILTSGLLSASE